MKNIFLITFFTIISPLSFAQIWSEDFQDEGNGATSGNDVYAPTGADWTSSCSSCYRFDRRATWVGNMFLAINDNLGTWTSELIDISGTGKAVIELTAWAYGTESDDYLRCYYSVDGGSYQLFYEVNDVGGLSADDPGTAIISGNDVRIKVEILSDGGSLFFGFPTDDAYGIDNVTVTAITDLYSAGSGDWATAGNWETTPGAADAAGPPTSTIYAHIEAGDGITTSAAATAAGVEVQSGGSLSINGAFALNINYGSTISVASGATITTSNSGSTLNLVSEAPYIFDIDGALTIGNIAINDGQDVTIDAGGAITVQQDILINGNAQVTNNHAALNIQNRLQFDTGSDGALLTNSGTINITQELFFANLNSGVINDGTISILDILQVQAAGDDGNYVTNNNVLSFGDLNIGNADFTLDNSGTITQNGNFSDGRIGTGSNFNNLNGGTWNWNGTIYDPDVPTVLDCSAATNTFNYSRGGSQNIMATPYNNLTVSGSGTKTLDGTTTVANTLTLTSGFVSLGANDLTLGNSASISGGSSSSFIITDGTGELIQNNLGSGGRTGDVVFPVGISSASYTPLTINNTTGTADNFGVIVDPDALDEGTTGNVQATAVIDRTWMITEAVAGGSDATITFQWNTSNELTSFDRTDLNIVHYDGMDWQVLGNTAAVGSDPWSASVSGVNSFSPFAIEDGMLAPLPVELVYFDAQLVDNKVELSWQTASELNNDFFTVEKTTDLINFEEVITVEGQGTSNMAKYYTSIDKFPYNGVSYYRLKQTDYDGTFTHSDIVRILNNNDKIPNTQFKLYPNPNNGQGLTLELEGMIANEMILVKLYNTQGKVMFSDKILSDNNGNGYTDWVLSTKLSAGIYKVNAIGTTSNKSLTQTLFVK